MSRKLVLLHGFLGGTWSYDAVLSSCQGHYDVLVPTLSFHEPSQAERSQPLRFSDEVRRLATEIERFAGSSTVTLVGYSMGGRLALGIGLHFPSRVDRLVLVSARRGLDTRAERAERIAADERWAQMLDREGLERFLEQWSDQPLFRGLKRLPPEVIARERERRLTHDACGLASALRQLGLGRQPSYASLVRQLEVPVSLIVGELDHKFLALSARLASELPRARCIVVEGASHQLLLEAPASVSRIIDEG